MDNQDDVWMDDVHNPPTGEFKALSEADVLLPVRIYKPPYGEIVNIECSNVYESDRDYFIRNEIVISMEELSTGEIVTYGCPVTDSSEESEVLVLRGGRSCQDTLRELAAECKIAFGDNK